MATNLNVTGMTCGHCEQRVVDALEDVQGVEAATADSETDSVSVEGDADVDALIGAVEDAGYSAIN